MYISFVFFSLFSFKPSETFRTHIAYTYVHAAYGSNVFAFGVRDRALFYDSIVVYNTLFFFFIYFSRFIGHHDRAQLTVDNISLRTGRQRSRGESEHYNIVFVYNIYIRVYMWGKKSKKEKYGFYMSAYVPFPADAFFH